jgi:hypothetical protein
LTPSSRPQGAGPRGIKHRFRQELPLADVQEALRRGERAGLVPDWLM